MGTENDFQSPNMNKASGFTWHISLISLRGGRTHESHASRAWLIALAAVSYYVVLSLRHSTWQRSCYNLRKEPSCSYKLAPGSFCLWSATESKGQVNLMGGGA